MIARAEYANAVIQGLRSISLNTMAVFLVLRGFVAQIGI